MAEEKTTTVATKKVPADVLTAAVKECITQATDRLVTRFLEKVAELSAEKVALEKPQALKAEDLTELWNKTNPELKVTVTKVGSPRRTGKVTGTCSALLASGKREGKVCGNKCYDHEEYCGHHSKSRSREESDSEAESSDEEKKKSKKKDAKKKDAKKKKDTKKKKDESESESE